jgi:hypothetical protein
VLKIAQGGAARPKSAPASERLADFLLRETTTSAIDERETAGFSLLSDDYCGSDTVGGTLEDINC